jgi:hypothetical protein
MFQFTRSLTIKCAIINATSVCTPDHRPGVINGSKGAIMYRHPPIAARIERPHRQHVRPRVLADREFKIQIRYINTALWRLDNRDHVLKGLMRHNLTLAFSLTL